MTHSSSLTLAQLLITRLCHDIVGPIGAINNGIEFLEDSASGMEKEAITLITDSAAQAINRVQFYRYLYGIIKEKESVNLQDKKTLAENFYRHSRVRLHWEENVAPLTPEDVRILCNLLFIAASSLIRGGDVTISITADATITIQATGASIMLQEGIAPILSGDSTIPPDTANVQAIYTMQLITTTQGTLKLTQEPHAFTLYYAPVKEQGASLYG